MNYWQKYAALGNLNLHVSECGIITCKFSAEYRQYAYVTKDEWMNGSGVFVHPCGDGPLHRINQIPNVYFL